MELRHLVSFLAIADELHFGRAAARLHLSQPSLSQQLQRLERSLGVELVARTSHDVRLTAAGKAFEAEARAIISQMRKATHTAREVAAGRTGVVSVGYNFPGGQHVVPAALTKMSAEYPDVSVTLVEQRTGPQLSALAAGDLDVAIVYGRPTSPDFRSRRLFRVPLVAVVGHGHTWAGRGGIPFGELARQQCVLFAREKSPAMYDAIQAAAEASGITLSVAHEVDDPSATAIVVSVKPLVGFASASRGLHIGSAVGGPRPAAVQLYDPVPTLDLYVVWRAANSAPLVDIFVDCIESARPFQVPAYGRAESRVRR
ncbi:LysR substrate-binding domain-containing protein [Frankia sp. AiPs1]|uniref:LysR family transcriptional regulator n=1 Tax=Frankia sp. AiPs1 TaxID=573493 RepID=UPI002043562B|nr:LysR substrate-binding domain-containing protein [Frankia sp. AiPs1]MCM3922968.1 LysR substrate-binding domain-containing protein [Frankia sp. AiPs1]